MGDAYGELEEDLGGIDQRLASLKQDAQQLRLAMETDIKADKKTRKLTEGAATAVQTKQGDSCSAKRVQVSPKRSTSFDVKAEPLALPCRDDVLVENGAVAPKSCLSPLAMRTPTTAGGLPPLGKTFTVKNTILHQLALWFCPAAEKKVRTSILCALYYSIFWWINNQQGPFWPRVIEIKSGQNLAFDPGGSTGYAYPFVGNVSRVVLWGGFR